MRTLKTLLSAVLLVFSCAACSSKPTYTTYRLNPAKTFVLVKSYWCEDVMNDAFDPLSTYLTNPPTSCQFSVLDLSASATGATVHAVYKEPFSFTVTPDLAESFDVATGSVTELSANAGLTLPQSITKDEPAALSLNVSGEIIYSKAGKKVSNGIYTGLVIRTMTVIEKAYQTAFTEPWSTVESEFDALPDPWMIEPQESNYVRFLNDDMTFTIPKSVNSSTVALILRLTLSHFEYFIFTYYEGQP
jgi:hypothetical protein